MSLCQQREACANWQKKRWIFKDGKKGRQDEERRGVMQERMMDGRSKGINKEGTRETKEEGMGRERRLNTYKG